MSRVFTILGGQERGNKESHRSIHEFIELFNGKVYVGSPHRWDRFEVEHLWIETKPLIYNSIFDASEHDHFMNYKYQWSALYQAYESIKNKIEVNDIEADN